jgi:hypothetical protein
MNNHKSIYIFNQPKLLHGDDGIDVINSMYWINNEPANKLFIENNCYPCPRSNHIHFKKGIKKLDLSIFLQSLADTCDDKLYFALRKNGNIWCIDKTGQDDLKTIFDN